MSAPTGRCAAPGCRNLTDRGICDDCDRWVDEQVRELACGGPAHCRACAFDVMMAAEIGREDRHDD